MTAVASSKGLAPGDMDSTGARGVQRPERNVRYPKGASILSTLFIYSVGLSVNRYSPIRDSVVWYIHRAADTGLHLMLSNAQERLGRATLSVALSFHLIDRMFFEDLETLLQISQPSPPVFVSRMPVGYLVSDITQFFQRSPGSQRIEGTHSEIADVR